MTQTYGKHAHALLSASGSKRWLTCTPSARLEEQFEEQTSEFAKEGTKAHELVEILLQCETKSITERVSTIRRNKLKKASVYVTYGRKKANRGAKSSIQRTIARGG